MHLVSGPYGVERHSSLKSGPLKGHCSFQDPWDHMKLSCTCISEQALSLLNLFFFFPPPHTNPR